MSAMSKERAEELREDLRRRTEDLKQARDERQKLADQYNKLYHEHEELKSKHAAVCRDSIVAHKDRDDLRVTVRAIARLFVAEMKS